MNWIIATDDNQPPTGIEILVKYKTGTHDIVVFENDNEYGYCAEVYEGYRYWKDIEKYCYLIED